MEVTEGTLTVVCEQGEVEDVLTEIVLSNIYFVTQTLTDALSSIAVRALASTFNSRTMAGEHG